MSGRGLPSTMRYVRVDGAENRFQLAFIALYETSGITNDTKRAAYAASAAYAAISAYNISVICDSNGIVAICVSTKTEKKQQSVRIHSLYVTEAHQRKGIGSAMIGKILKKLRKKSITVSVAVAKENQGALLFWGKMNMSEIKSEDENDRCFSTNVKCTKPFLTMIPNPEVITMLDGLAARMIDSNVFKRYCQ